MALGEGQIISWYVCTMAALVFLIIRMVVKWRKFQTFSIEDYFLILAASCLVGDLAIQQYMWNLGMASHGTASSENLKHIMQCKVTFYKRISARTGLQKVYNAVLGFLAVSWTVIFFDIIFQFFLVDRKWTTDPSQTCSTQASEINYWLTIFLYIGTDVVIIILPISMVAKLQMPLKQKFGVAGMFALGLFVVIGRGSEDELMKEGASVSSIGKAVSDPQGITVAREYQVTEEPEGEGKEQLEIIDEANSKHRRGLGAVTANECRKKRAKQKRVECRYEVPVRLSKEHMRSEIEQLRTKDRHSERVLAALAPGDRSDQVLHRLRSGEKLENIAEQLDKVSPGYVDHDATLTTITRYSDYSAVGNAIQSVRNIGDEFTRSLRNSHGLGEQIKSESPQQRSEGVIWPGSDAGSEQDDNMAWEPDQPSTARHGLRSMGDTWPQRSSSQSGPESTVLYARERGQETILGEDFGINRTADPTIVNGSWADTAEALRLLNAEKDRHVLTTIQALGLMSIREASCRRSSESLFISGQSIRLAIEMGLYMDRSEGESEEAEVEHAVRSATFGGTFSLDQAWSLSIGRLPQFSRDTKLVTKLAIIDHIEATHWIPYNDDGIHLQHK
ncbi:hypothetical protein G7Y89_g11418 [Cudoniella acicularis]|uniref:Uncharacterized protein n=1 Tax=Cudoniella acicularis TaxID=354080 RepID=A0A8H4RDJ0_9HELO|nr:hypothetical protein G7Y89_g11418 [Cudoniella acicularis]